MDAVSAGAIREKNRKWITAPGQTCTGLLLARPLHLICLRLHSQIKPDSLAGPGGQVLGTVGEWEGKGQTDAETERWCLYSRPESQLGTNPLLVFPQIFPGLVPPHSQDWGRWPWGISPHVCGGSKPHLFEFEEPGKRWGAFT